MRVREYDMPGLGIRCRADMIGAKIFEVKDSRIIGPVTVLAYDQNHAETTLRALDVHDFPDHLKGCLFTDED